MLVMSLEKETLMIMKIKVFPIQRENLLLV